MLAVSANMPYRLGAAATGVNRDWTETASLRGPHHCGGTGRLGCRMSFGLHSGGCQMLAGNFVPTKPRASSSANSASA